MRSHRYAFLTKQATSESPRNCHPRQTASRHSPKSRAAPRLHRSQCMTRTPDEDYDVILYACRGTWTVWFTGEKLGERLTFESALELAREVAAAHRKPAWLADASGYPLKLEPHRATHPLNNNATVRFPPLRRSLL